MANCNLVFGNLESLGYDKTNEVENYIKAFNKSLYRNKSKQRNFKMIMINLNKKFIIFCLSIVNSKSRTWLLNRIKK